MSLEENRKFSIFDPEIASHHREHYENIVRELITIFAICNQGQSFAEELVNTNHDKSKIDDLMSQARSFGYELFDGSRALFDQYYQAKETFAHFIYSNAAYVKINLLDRNLLERTCDVRWWAMETAFCQALEFANELHELLASCEDPAIRENLPAILANKSSIMGMSEIRQLDPMIQSKIRECHDKSRFACERLEDIISSYTLYRDLVIVTKEGYVIANANPKTRDTVLGMNVTDENWYQKAVATKNGTEYYAQDLSRSKLESQLSLIYSTAVRQNSETEGKVIGAMGVLFDFQGEGTLILSEDLPIDVEGEVEEGWFAFLTNEQGEIIHSMDEEAFPIGIKPYLPRKHRKLSKGEKRMSYSVVHGVESIIVSAKTDGYLEYEGLGWTSHVVVPKKSIFQAKNKRNFDEISHQDLMKSSIIPKINQDTLKKVEKDRNSITLITVNGGVFAEHTGAAGRCLSPIFEYITNTGKAVTSMMENLLIEMAHGYMEQNLAALQNFAGQAINTIDRNLFERSADIRWWSTDSWFWKALENPNQENFNLASKRLRVINDSYTMYRNLILADLHGNVVACSDQNMMATLSRIVVKNHEWYEKACRTSKATEYAVQDVIHSELDPDKERTLIYAGGIRRNGSRESDTIGALGVLFDWDTEAKVILKNCLPRDRDGSPIPGCAAFYTNNKWEIIETSDPKRFPVGSRPQFSEYYLKTMQKERACSGFLIHQDAAYIIGTSMTKGYREYPGLEWRAHIIRPFTAEKISFHAGVNQEESIHVDEAAVPPVSEDTVKPLRDPDEIANGNGHLAEPPSSNRLGDLIPDFDS